MNKPRLSQHPAGCICAACEERSRAVRSVALTPDILAGAERHAEMRCSCGDCWFCRCAAEVERSRPREFDALHSILRALEPLTHEQQVRVVAAARCFFESAAAKRALDG